MKENNSKAFLLILLGALTAFGPLVTDMYLPSLPTMTGYFDTNSSMVQLGLTSSMIGLAIGQIFFGPLSDKYGRRPLLLISMLLFIVSTVFCIFSPNIESFIAFRLLQGIAGSGGIVISRSVATDKFSGQDLAKAMAIIGAINGIAPVASPVLGGFLTDSIGWKGIFIILLIIGIILLIGNFRFKESLPKSNRKQENIKGLLWGFGKILHNRRYVFYVLQMGFAMGVLFANISSSPFIMQQHYGFSAFTFSLFFGINALSIGFIALSNNCSFIIYETLLFFLLFTMGLTFTASTTLAMDSERQNSGTASALFGATGFAFGGIVSPLVSIGDILPTTGLIFLLCSSCSLGCAIIALRQTHPHLWINVKRKLKPTVQFISASNSKGKKE